MFDHNFSSIDTLFWMVRIEKKILLHAISQEFTTFITKAKKFFVLSKEDAQDDGKSGKSETNGPLLWTSNWI